MLFIHQGGVCHDIVVRCSPLSPPYCLVPLAAALRQQGITVITTTARHSSLPQEVSFHHQSISLRLGLLPRITTFWIIIHSRKFPLFNYLSSIQSCLIMIILIISLINFSKPQESHSKEHL